MRSARRDSGRQTARHSHRCLTRGYYCEAVMQYIVYRLGWSDANQKPQQGLPQKMAVMRVDAGSAEEACRLAATQVSLTASQRLVAEPADAADDKEVNRNLRVEALPHESNEIGGNT